MGWFSNIVSKVKNVYKKADTALGGHLPGGVTPGYVKKSKNAPTITTPPSIDKEGKPSYGAPVFTPEEQIEAKAKDKDKDKDRKVEVPEGRKATDIEAEVELRSQGLMTVQTGTDEIGDPITTIIPIEGYAEQSAAAQKADADLAVKILAMGAAATPGTLLAARYWTGISGKGGKVGIFSKTGNVVNAIQTNPKTTKLVTSIISKFFSTKALVFYGGWAASVGMGMWAQAEAPEGVTFPVTKFLIPEAEKTGDWTAVNEALDLADEITNLSTWEKIIGLSPFAVIPGAINKIKGNIAGKEIVKEYSADQQEKQSTGQTEEEYWEQRDTEQKAQEQFNIDYYNNERKKLLIWEREAEVLARNEDAKFWRRERDAQMKREAEDREAIALFWLEYRKLAQKISEDSRPSNLNFGLI